MKFTPLREANRGIRLLPSPLLVTRFQYPFRVPRPAQAPQGLRKSGLCSAFHNGLKTKPLLPLRSRAAVRRFSQSENFPSPCGRFAKKVPFWALRALAESITWRGSFREPTSSFLTAQSVCEATKFGEVLCKLWFGFACSLLHGDFDTPGDLGLRKSPDGAIETIESDVFFLSVRSGGCLPDSRWRD